MSEQLKELEEILGISRCENCGGISDSNGQHFCEWYFRKMSQLSGIMAQNNIINKMYADLALTGTSIVKIEI